MPLCPLTITHFLYLFSAKEGLKDLRIDFSNGPLAAYKSMIALNILRKDEHQVLLVEKLEELFRRIQNYEPYKPGAIGKVSTGFYFD